MAFMNIDSVELYYEIHGEGFPLLILNGIMMSTVSWQKLIPHLHEAKVILLDFPDQGKSRELKKLYSQEDIAKIVGKFIENLGFEKIDILGISYGGEIAQILSINLGEKIRKLILVNTTPVTTKQLKAIGDSWLVSTNKYDGKKLFEESFPLIYSYTFYENNSEWIENRLKLIPGSLTRKWLEGFGRLVVSAENLNVIDRLKKITADTLIISADEDLLTPSNLQDILEKEIVNSKRITIHKCGHASMYEQPEMLISIVKGFLMTNKKIRIL
ncbi:alpha/beta hydrolase [Clostridiaceae bacterium HSG29]|nr:alpha/beta hydrolase [Clostridiaceae bacterium HSG29]